jgi:hypothetical protein
VVLDGRAHEAAPAPPRRRHVHDDLR